MDPQIQALRFWHDLITFDALLLGMEGPVLLWISTFLDRPRAERALSLVPVLAFAWGAWSAKLINDEAVNATSALRWGHAHYPTFPVTVDAAAAVQSATRTGWTAGVIAALLLIGGWLLVLRWSRGEGLPHWRIPPARSRGTATVPPAHQPVPITGMLDDESNEGIEITVEYMDD
jgi:hypothetical protein